MNFLRLCELLVKKCPSLKTIRLMTSADPQPSGHREQVEKLEVLQPFHFELSSQIEIRLKFSSDTTELSINT